MSHDRKSPGGRLSACLLLASVFAATPMPSLAQVVPAPDPGTGPEPQEMPPIQGGTGGGTSLSPAPFRPEKFAISPGGVDMRSGTYTYSHVDLAIGGSVDDGGIEFIRTMGSGVFNHNEPFGTFGHNWDIFITEERIPVIEANVPSEYDYMLGVVAGGRSKTFRGIYSAIQFNQVSNDERASLVDLGGSQGGSYQMRAVDQTIVNFRHITSPGCQSADRCANVIDITQPNGVKFTFEYDPRLRSVTSNRGYALLLEYVGSSSLISKACVLNLALTAKPSTNICPSGATATTSYGYDGNGQLTSVTDATGQVWTFGYTVTGLTTGTRSFTKPGASSPYLTNTHYGKYITSQQFADGRSYTYSWESPAGDVAGGTYTDAGNRSVLVRFGAHELVQDNDPTMITSPGPERIVDELGRVTTYDYCHANSPAGECIVSRMDTRVDPEGNASLFKYDVSLNIIETRRQAKPGTGLADIVTTATYNCSNALWCAKPATTTDAMGRTTTYSYDPFHGQILTETGPAVNGVSPQKRYIYSQKYAWYKNAAGTLVQAPTPVWLLTQESQCRTTAASGSGCAGGTADEIKIVYEYGPAGVANNLLLRGKVFDPGGLNLRTCYKYDAQGNKIAETEPKAGLASCS